MHISPKIFMVGAAGAAALSFVGVGAGAAFTSAATANGTAQTGHTGITLSTDYAQVLCSSDGASCDGKAGDATLVAGSGSGTSSLVLGTAGNLGSSFSMSFPVTLTNSGTLNLKSGSVKVSDVDSTGGPGQALAKETTVTLNVDGLGQVAKDSLYNLEQAAGNQINFTVPNGSLAVGQSVTGTVTVTSQSAGLDNSAQSGTVSPTLTITGSDA